MYSSIIINHFYIGFPWVLQPYGIIRVCNLSFCQFYGIRILQFNMHGFVSCCLCTCDLSSIVINNCGRQHKNHFSFRSGGHDLKAGIPIYIRDQHSRLTFFCHFNFIHGSGDPIRCNNTDPDSKHIFCIQIILAIRCNSIAFILHLHRCSGTAMHGASAVHKNLLPGVTCRQIQPHLIIFQSVLKLFHIQSHFVLFLFR